MDLANKVRNRREELGWSQEELAHKMGYSSRTSINKIEMGRPCSQKIIARLAEALNVSIAYLMDWDQEQISTIEEVKNDANTYDDGMENELLSFKEEFAEMHFTPVEILQIRMFMHSMREQEVKIDLGASIKEARESKGMTKEQLAEMLEVPVEMVDLYEGSMSFPYEQMKKLNSILGISFYTMLGIPQEDASLYEKIYFLHLNEEEMKDVYKYAEYVKSKRK